MEWTDIVVKTSKQQADVAADVVTSYASGGFYVEDYSDLEQGVREIAHIDLIDEALLQKPRDEVRLHLYLSPEESPAPVLEALRGALLAAGVAHSIETEGVEQEDWETSWKQYYHPIEIGRRLAVAPTWEAYESDRVTLRLDPGMAFGTGTHETTFLCMEVLDELVRGGERVLDIGTGSGILAIAALLLGAREAEGVDIDPMCVRTAGENAHRNGVEERFRIEIGDLAQKAGGQYDIITANIVADAIVRLAPAVPQLLAHGAPFIASGIIEEREDEVRRALGELGLDVYEVRRKRGWVAMLAKRRA